MNDLFRGEVDPQGAGGSSTVDGYDVLLLDLDGVVYRGPTPVAGAVESLTAAAQAGLRLLYVTNNAARPPQAVSTHLQQLGLAADPDDVVTSAQAGAAMVREMIPVGSTVLAVGGPGVAAALEAVGLLALPAAAVRGRDLPEASVASKVDAVMQGFGPDVSWRDLALAAYAVQAGAVWVATNTDRTIPRESGIAPGNGTLVDAVAAATGVRPPVAGKPHEPIMREAIKRARARTPLVVGDRLDTDIAGANNVGVDSLLVLTGVSTLSDALLADAGQRPTMVAPDLGVLSSGFPAAGLEGPAEGIRVVGDQLRVETAAASRDDLPSLLTSACRKAWTYRDDTGRTPDVAAAVEVLQRRITRS